MKKDLVKRFFADEDGMEALQVVMILAIAAVICVAILAWWNKGKQSIDGKMDVIFGK